MSINYNPSTIINVQGRENMNKYRKCQTCQGPLPKYAKKFCAEHRDPNASSKGKPRPPRTPEQQAKHREYMRDYMYRRYNEETAAAQARREKLRTKARDAARAKVDAKVRHCKQCAAALEPLDKAYCKPCGVKAGTRNGH